MIAEEQPALRSCEGVAPEFLGRSLRNPTLVKVQ